MSTGMLRGLWAKAKRLAIAVLRGWGAVSSGEGAATARWRSKAEEELMPEQAPPRSTQDLNPFRLDELARVACGENVDRWPPGLKAVLAACASASLAQEEGAYLRCAVALHPERRANNAQLMMIGFTPFAEPRPLELNTLVKLGSGTTPTATCLVAAGDTRYRQVSTITAGDERIRVDRVARTWTPSCQGARWAHGCSLARCRQARARHSRTRRVDAARSSRRPRDRVQPGWA